MFALKVHFNTFPASLLSAPSVNSAGACFVYNFAIKFILTVKIKFNGRHLSQVKITQFTF